MAANDVKTSEEAEMSECDGEKVVTMMDVLQEQADFEEDANAVLGASDDKNCTYPKGYVKRQAIYACLTCCPEANENVAKRAGVCLACSLTCHENHELAELYTKRNFRCDCGNPKFSQPCQFTPNKSDLNYDNKYNQNFSGVYCVCHRPYPDPEAVEEEEMIQCIICEDWLHTNHLEATVPLNDQYAEMICKDCMEDNDFLHDYSDLIVNVADKEIIVTDPDLDVATILKMKAKKEAAKKESLTNGASNTSADEDKAAESEPSNNTSTEDKEHTAEVNSAETKPEGSAETPKDVTEEANDTDKSNQNCDTTASTTAENITESNDKVTTTEVLSEETITKKSDSEIKESLEATDKEQNCNVAISENADETPITNEKEESADKIDENPKEDNKDQSAEKVDEEPKEDEKENIVPTSDKECEASSNTKRKLSTEELEDTSPKKPKLDTKPCIRPRGVKRVYKGATFWPSNLRQKLCTCNECVAMYKDLAVLFLIDPDDTVSAYEALGKINNEGALSSQYEKGLQALSSLDRVQQINALTEYNKMRDKLLDFLKSFKDRKEIVKEEDIKAFFAGMKPKREPDGVYFCR